MSDEIAKSQENENSSSLEINSLDLMELYKSSEIDDQALQENHVQPFLSRYNRLPAEYASTVNEWIDFFAERNGLLAKSVKEAQNT